MLSRVAARVLAPFKAAAGSYNSLLERRPLPTKSITSGVMYMAGDLIAQRAEHYHKAKEAPAGEAVKPFSINYTRAAIFLVYGTIIAGPLYHAWFSRLDTLPVIMFKLKNHRKRAEIMRAYALLQRNGIKVELTLDKLPAAKPFHPLIEKGAKIAADQLIFSSLYTVLFFMCIGTATGGVEKLKADARRHSMEEAHQVIRSKYSKKADLALERQLLGLKQRVGGEAREDVDRVLALLKEEEEAAAMESISWGRIVANSWQHTKDQFLETYILDCIVWPPLQYINFSFVPLRLQVLFVNGANLFWNTYLSFAANKPH